MNFLTADRPLVVNPNVERILRRMEAGLDRGEVPLSIYGDPEIHALELERIFGRCWTFVAHESEIPAPGDYVQRYVADTPFIVSRDESGAIHVMFDSCRHRGVKLCRSDRGNAGHFRCPYHGWTYRSDGALVGVPNRSEAYKLMRDEDWGLLHARVDTYHGLIFACMDEATPPLAEYLGDFRWYLDIHFGLAPEGLEVVGSPLRWIVAGNWKSAAENFAGDSYHTQWLHRSIPETGIRPAPPVHQFNVHVTECSGHATSIARTGPDGVAFWGNSADYAQLYRGTDLAPAQLELARRSLTGQGTVFPNMSFIHVNSNDDPAKERSSFLGVSLWQPKSATTTEIWRWVLVPKTYSRAAKERSYTVAVSNFGPAGNAEQDDATVWSGTAASGRSTFARKNDATLNYTMGLPGMSEAKQVADWPGPGTVYDARLEDGVQRTILRNWLQRMTAE
jgi:PAH dioxygenase large subunit